MDERQYDVATRAQAQAAPKNKAIKPIFRTVFRVLVCSTHGSPLPLLMNRSSNFSEL